MFGPYHAGSRREPFRALFTQAPDAIARNMSEPLTQALRRPLTIGHGANAVTVPNRVFLAPMSGVTDLPFRRIAERCGAGLVVSEMVASRELTQKHPESELRCAGDGLRLHAVQLAGREAKWMALAARRAESSGARLIDINMGCPARKVTGGLSGSALMRDLDHALTLIEATVDAVEVPVTLKMRLGWDFDCLNAPDLARRAEAAGVAMVTIHGRTRNQFYEGRADWNAVRAVREVIDVPLVVNGDIDTTEDCRAALERSGADAVMVGRASQGRPWHCAALAGAPTPFDPSVVALEHYEANVAHHGGRVGVRHARKHVGWYMDRTDAPAQLRRAAMTSDDPHEVLRLLEEALAPMRAAA